MSVDLRLREPASEPGELGGESFICGCGVTDGVTDAVIAVVVV